MRGTKGGGRGGVHQGILAMRVGSGSGCSCRGALTVSGAPWLAVPVAQRELNGRNYYEFEFTASNPRYTRHQLAVVAAANGEPGQGSCGGGGPPKPALGSRCCVSPGGARRQAVRGDDGRWREAVGQGQGPPADHHPLLPAALLSSSSSKQQRPWGWGAKRTFLRAERDAGSCDRTGGRRPKVPPGISFCARGRLFLRTVSAC